MYPLVIIAVANMLVYENYYVSYNYTNGFANYAVAACNYSSKNPSCQCYSKPRWNSSPNYTCSDYTNTSYDRSHLIPNSEYGAQTCQLSNAVPMTQFFNRVTWAKQETYLRSKYTGFLIFRGCGFGDKTIKTKTNKIMKIPDGCYWIVVNATTISDVSNKKFEVIDYSYIDMKTLEKERKLPWWAVLVSDNNNTNYKESEEEVIPLWIPGTILLIIVFVVISTFYATLYLSRSLQSKKSENNMSQSYEL